MTTQDPAAGESRDAILADPRLDPQQVHDALCRAVQRACPPWLADRREDLVQAAMTKILSLRRDEHGRALSRSYLWKAAYSAVADEIRRVRRRAENPLEEAPESPAPTGGGHDPDAFVALGDLGEALRDCLLGMLESRRVIVQLHLLDHDLAEIEDLTRQGGKRVRNLLYRGLADLRECLGKKGFGP